MAGLFVAYRLGRQLANGREDLALAHAKDVWETQRLLGMPSEEVVQRLVLHSTGLVRLANEFYIGVHFPAAVVFMVWVLVRHRDQWTRVRNVLVLVTGAALVMHVLYPLAPPRFLPPVLPGVDLVDTGMVIGPGPYTSEATSGASNQYAAMPSMHVGWAIVEAWGIVTILRARARWLALAQPVVTLAVVVVTANHYWMDGLVGGALVAAAVWLTAPKSAAVPGWRRPADQAPADHAPADHAPADQAPANQVPAAAAPAPRAASGRALPFGDRSAAMSDVGDAVIGGAMAGGAVAGRADAGGSPDATDWFQPAR